MIDFSQFKKLSIGGAELKQLFINGVQVWKSGYRNLVEIATTEPGGTEIYNGTGYKDDYRWSSSGKTEVATDAGRITGWIPFTPGATYRIKNFYISKPSGYVSGGYIARYNNGTITTIVIGRNNADYDAATDTFTWTETSTSIQYFRISAYKCDEQPIITMNEEIPE